MRVLVIQPTADKRGHYGIYTVKLCQALARLGHEVTLCTNALDPSNYLREAPKFRLIQVGGGRYSFAGYDAAATRRRLLFYFGYFRNCYVVTSAAAALCRRESFDVITIMDTEFLIASLVLGRHRRHLPPVVMPLWATNFSFSAYHRPIVEKVYKVAQREVFRTALGTTIKALAVLGEWHREQLRTQLRLPETFPIAVIPDGGEAPGDVPDRVAARARLGIPANTCVFLFFGILRRDKGVEHLLEAMSLLQKDDAMLLLAGWPMEYSVPEIEGLIRRFRLKDKVLLHLDYVPDADIPWHFAASDALVLPYPAAYTGGSGPLMKGACTYGRPVIATDVSEMGRLVHTHQMGLVAIPGDPESLASRMREFIALSAEQRLQMGERATALALANSWDRMAERFSAIYDSLVVDGRSGRTRPGATASTGA